MISPEPSPAKMAVLDYPSSKESAFFVKTLAKIIKFICVLQGPLPKTLCRPRTQPDPTRHGFSRIRVKHPSCQSQLWRQSILKTVRRGWKQSTSVSIPPIQRAATRASESIGVSVGKSYPIANDRDANRNFLPSSGTVTTGQSPRPTKTEASRAAQMRATKPPDVPYRM